MGRAGTPESLVAGVYDRGAGAYDEHWAPVLHDHARALVDRLPQDGPRTVLDLGAGTGTLVPVLRTLAGGRRGLLVLLDRSRGMLSRADHRLPRLQADAARLPLADATVDVVVMAFVLSLLPDAHRAVAEGVRVLRPTGWLLTATWVAEAGSDADTVVAEELDRAAAPSFPELPRSDDLADSPTRMTAVLEAAGLIDVRTEQRPLGATFAPESTLALRTGFGRMGWRFDQLGPSAREGVRRRAADRLALLTEDAFVDRSEVLLCWSRSASARHDE
ncbi:MAG: class I SAM-dependent methyltransferase [Nocardioidaceae bacterium]